jgi:hypothetical protein
MATHDLVIDNQTMPATRSDINSALQALGGQMAGTADPSVMYAYEMQARTDLGTRRRRNAANTGWINDGTLAETFVIDRASNTILGTADFMRIFRATAGFTQTLTAAATLGDGWYVDIRIESGVTLVLDPNGSETIDGATTKSILGPSSGRVVCNGASFYTIGFSTAVFSASSMVGAVCSYVGMINGTIVASRAASAETIAIKTLAGSDPSSGDPVIFVFRNATAATGDYVFLTATAALSITISSGSTMGASSGVPFRLWLTVFNDASTLRLGVVNCLSGTSIMALGDNDLRSSTAEGGAGAADSAQVIYTGTAVTTKAMRVLGYLEYTLGTAGTWATAPSKVQLFGPGVPLPGTILQRAENMSGAVATGTTNIPTDDTIPQNTEGDQYMSQAITPNAAMNILTVDAKLQFGSSSSASTNAVALFQDATASALAVGPFLATAGCENGSGLISYRAATGSVSATTFKVRAGGNIGATLTFNGASSARLYGGVPHSTMTIQEIMA